MKRLLTLAMFMLYSLFSIFAQYSGSGSGTENDPYLILNPIQLNQMRNFLNKSDVYFKLMADIDLTEFLEDENPNQGWLPVGTESAPFKGVLDGNGRTISGLWIARSSADYVGLFGYVARATIKSLNIKDVDIVGNQNVGVLSGYSEDVTINHISLTGKIKGNMSVGGCIGASLDSPEASDVSSLVDVVGGDYTGGLIGRILRLKSYSFATCRVQSRIMGANYVGGIVGGIDSGAGSLTECSFIGRVVGSSCVGGVVGRCDVNNNVMMLQQCNASADVICNGDYSGGLMGFCNSWTINSSKTNMICCYFNGAIKGQNYTGGLIGYFKGDGIVKSYSRGSISGAECVGGLLGKSLSCKLQSNVSIVNTIKATAGKVGRIYGVAERTSCGQMGTSLENKSYNRTIVISQGVSQNITDDLQNGTGVSATTLKLKATYVGIGWDFNDIWDIQETECYPYFKSQTTPPVIQSQVVSGATIVSGKCIDGGKIVLEIDGEKQQMESTGHSFLFTVNPLQAGHEVRVSAKAEGKEQSYYTTEVVSFIGKGTADDPYQISTAADLTQVYRNGYYKLMNDIDLSDYIDNYCSSEGWESIGRDGSETIYIDGDGHKVTGLWCNTARNNTGLFSCFANGYIKNLTVETASGKQVKGGANTGILIGKMINGTIENCLVSGSLGDGTPVGGIVGMMDNGSLLKCRAEVSINTTSSTSYIGGLVGEITAGEIDQCYTNGTLTAAGSESYVGGLVGKNYSLISNCYSDASIHSSYNAAGLVAYNYGVVEKSYSTGNLFSNNYAAGVIGYNDGSNAVVKNCAAMNSKIDVVYESQQVQQSGGYGQRIIGGIKNEAPAPELNNYALKTMQLSVNDIAQNVYDDIMNGIAKTSAEMMSAAVYTTLGWDFSSVWSIVEGSQYPRLQWEFNLNPVTDIAFDNNTLIVEIDKQGTITANVRPANASVKELSWSSDNESVATVEDGVVTGIAIGQAAITATATDGSGVTATCDVTVVASKEVAIAELQAIVDEAQSLYDNSIEGESVGEYVVGSRAALLAVINDVQSRISSTMSYDDISACTSDINVAIAEFQSKKVTAGEDTDISTLQNVIYIDKVEAQSGSQMNLSIKMKNNANIRSFQFDLYLPEGVTAVKNAKGRIMGSLNSGRLPEDDEHTLTMAVQPDGAIRFLCGSQYDETFAGTDGEIASLQVNISEDMDEGDYPIILKSIRLSETDISKFYDTPFVKTTLTISNYILGDINGDGIVNVTDYTGVANHILGFAQSGFNTKAADVNTDNVINVSDYTGVANIILSGNVYGQSNAVRAMMPTVKRTPTDLSTLNNIIYVEPMTVAKGTQATLSFQMKNNTDIRSFQFDLYLPEGVTAVTNSNGRIMASLSSGRLPEDDEHTLTMAFQPNGAIRFLCGSQYDESFTGTDGEIATLQVLISDSMNDGDYPIIIKDMRLSKTDINQYFDSDNIETTLTVGDNTVVLDENSTEVPVATSGDVNIKVKRTINANEWSTICLPFDMTESQLKEAFGEDVELSEFDSYDAEYDADDNVTSIVVNFSPVNLTEGLYANTPYIIRTKSDISEFNVTATINPDEENALVEYDNGKTGKRREVYGTFYGTYHANTIVPANALFISGNNFYYSTGLTKMKAFRAYFEFEDVLSSVDGSATIRMSMDRELTGISDVLRAAPTDAYYDLQGRRVLRPSKGVYIYQGKKIYVK